MLSVWANQPWVHTRTHIITQECIEGDNGGVQDTHSPTLIRRKLNKLDSSRPVCRFLTHTHTHTPIAVTHTFMRDQAVSWAVLQMCEGQSRWGEKCEGGRREGDRKHRRASSNRNKIWTTSSWRAVPKFWSVNVLCRWCFYSSGI